MNIEVGSIWKKRFVAEYSVEYKVTQITSDDHIVIESYPDGEFDYCLTRDEFLKFCGLVERAGTPKTGMKVSLRLGGPFKGVEDILNNITEIHYRYASSDRMAFESDIHGTGVVHDIEDILEMEVIPQDAIADHF